LVPIGSPVSNVAERSIFPGNGLICHFRGDDVGEPGIGPPRQGAEISGNVGEDLEACRDAETQPGVGAVEDLAAVPSTDIDAVLLLKAAPRHHKAGIGDVGPIGGDFDARLRAAVGSRRSNDASEEGQKAEKRCRKRRIHSTIISKGVTSGDPIRRL
jgi:hypothetical protein